MKIGESKIYHFNDGDVRVERMPNGEIWAIDDANHDLGWSVGVGDTVLSAIYDLNEQLKDRGLL